MKSARASNPNCRRAAGRSFASAGQTCTKTSIWTSRAWSFGRFGHWSRKEQFVPPFLCSSSFMRGVARSPAEGSDEVEVVVGKVQHWSSALRVPLVPAQDGVVAGAVVEEHESVVRGQGAHSLNALSTHDEVSEASVGELHDGVAREVVLPMGALAGLQPSIRLETRIVFPSSTCSRTASISAAHARLLLICSGSAAVARAVRKLDSANVGTAATPASTENPTRPLRNRSRRGSARAKIEYHLVVRAIATRIRQGACAS